MNAVKVRIVHLKRHLKQELLHGAPQRLYFHHSDYVEPFRIKNENFCCNDKNVLFIEILFYLFEQENFYLLKNKVLFINMKKAT